MKSGKPRRLAEHAVDAIPPAFIHLYLPIQCPTGTAQKILEYINSMLLSQKYNLFPIITWFIHIIPRFKHHPPLSPTNLFLFAPYPVSFSSLVSIRRIQSPLPPSCSVTDFPSASLFLSCSCSSPPPRGLLHEQVRVHSPVYSVPSSCSLVYAHPNASHV